MDKGIALSGTYESPVYYEDTDFSGFVYHANHLKFMERGREHLLGIENIRELFRENLHFVVSNIQIKYVSPLKHGESFRVVSDSFIKSAPAFICEQNIYASSDDRLISTAEVKIVCIGANNRPTKVPASFLDKLSSTENSQ